MAKPEQNSSSEAFEMIELAIDDLDLLTRAFEVIELACRDEALPEETARPTPWLIN